jgi:hypothetical protein
MIYTAMERHLGVLAAFLLTLLWMQRHRQAPRRTRFTPLLLTGLAAVFLAHIGAAYFTIRPWLEYEYSQSRNAGDFLNAQHPDAIVICEPDFWAEPLPYYCANPIYIIREERFGDHCRFIGPYNQPRTLGDVIGAAERLFRETGKPVIVALMRPPAETGDDVLGVPFGRHLYMAADQVERFRERFVPIASFYGGCESYVLYRLKTQS